MPFSSLGYGHWHWLFFAKMLSYAMYSIDTSSFPSARYDTHLWRAERPLHPSPHGEISVLTSEMRTEQFSEVISYRGTKKQRAEEEVSDTPSHGDKKPQCRLK